jgi:hypothetical protein
VSNSRVTRVLSMTTHALPSSAVNDEQRGDGRSGNSIRYHAERDQNRTREGD